MGQDYVGLGFTVTNMWSMEEDRAFFKGLVFWRKLHKVLSRTTTIYDYSPSLVSQQRHWRIGFEVLSCRQRCAAEAPAEIAAVRTQGFELALWGLIMKSYCGPEL